MDEKIGKKKNIKRKRKTKEKHQQISKKTNSRPPED